MLCMSVLLFPPLLPAAAVDSPGMETIDLAQYACEAEKLGLEGQARSIISDYYIDQACHNRPNISPSQAYIWRVVTEYLVGYRIFGNKLCDLTSNSRVGGNFSG